MATLLVVGAGYVGLTTAVCFSNMGHQVTAYDLDTEKVSKLSQGQVTFFEPGLPELLLKCSASGKLKFVSHLDSEICNVDFVFLCVPTPQDQDGSADLSYVLNATETLRPLLKPGTVLVTKSTVPVGSHQRIQEILQGSQIEVASNPEFLREGSALRDFMEPDRIVVGAGSIETANSVAQLYADIDAPIIRTSSSSAELIKYASNAFLALKISFANDIAALCETLNADAQHVLRGIGADSRIGSRFLNPGPGWGGSCFPKDTRALITIMENCGINPSLIEASLDSNERTKKRVVDMVANALGGRLEGMRIAVWGLAFKANTDDTRDSPAISVIQRLLDRGATVCAFDPAVSGKNLVGVTFASSALDATVDADCLVVLTEWDQFASVDHSNALRLMRRKNVIDTRGVLEAKVWSRDCSTFRQIGAAQ